MAWWVRAVEYCVGRVRFKNHFKKLILITHPGRQHLGALFNVLAYYALALPVGITLAFHPRTHLGLEGLWAGMYQRS